MGCYWINMNFDFKYVFVVYVEKPTSLLTLVDLLLDLSPNAESLIVYK